MIRQRLLGWDVAVAKGSRPVKSDDGAPEGMDEVWLLVYRERETGNEITFEMSREIRDFVVRGLTGGIVLAGGDLPQA